MSERELKTKNGQPIGPVGLGTFPLRGDVMKDTMLTAFQAGYKLFDTSDDYWNEDGIGSGLEEGINKGLFSREDIFLQTKVSVCDSYLMDYRQNSYFTRYSSVMKNFSVRDVVRSQVFNSLKEMKTNYADSVLLHFAYPSFYEEMWESLIELKNEGFIRHIGVSNFNVKERESLKNTAQVPEINEIYISPFGTKRELVNYCRENNIQVMTYSPLCVIRGNMFNNDVIPSLCQKYGKSQAQIVLRWNHQVGSIPLPKSGNEIRLKENHDLLDFELTEEEMNELNKLDFNHQYMPISKECPGL